MPQKLNRDAIMAHHWDDIRYFLALCRNQSFVAAADDLNVTHSTVSRRISSLEDSLQTRLFERTERGCRLTTAAEQLLPYAEQIESSVISLEETVAGKDKQLSGSIRIGAPDGIGTYFLGPRLGRFQDKHPDLEIELIAVPMYFSLTKREIDISITIEQPTSGNIVTRRLTKYRLGLFASKSYFNGKSKVRKKKDLKEHRIIGYIDDLLFDKDLRFMDEISPGLKASFKSSTVIAQKSAVLSGSGIGILPYFMINKSDDLVPVLPSISIERCYWLQVHSDSKYLARVRAVTDYIFEQVELNTELFMNPPKN